MTKTATVHAQQRWEYLEMTRKSVTYLVKELNEPGLQGWELVSTLQAKDRKGEPAWTAILKRPYVPDGSPPYQPTTAVPAGASAPDEHRFEPPGEDSDFQLEKEELPAPQEAKLPLQDEEP